MKSDQQWSVRIERRPHRDAAAPQSLWTIVADVPTGIYIPVSGPDGGRWVLNPIEAEVVCCIYRWYTGDTLF